MNRRVVITGVGAISPVGNTFEESWQSVKSGKNGIAHITQLDTAVQKACMGGEVKDFSYPNTREGKRLDRSSQLALTAVKEALELSGLLPGENINEYRFGVMAGTGIGGITTLEKEFVKAHNKGVRMVSPLMVPMVIPNMIAGNVSIAIGAKGESIGLVTACAAGTHAIGEAYRSIKHGYADAVAAGGAESSFAPVCFAGFANMTALSTRTDPNRCSTPFDKERDGFVMGEGAAFLILEEYEHAKTRGAKVMGELVGYGATSDAYHITSPSPDGEGAAEAMKQSIAYANIDIQDIDYINAHGTGTPLNDLFETRAIKSVFGKYAYNVPVSSTKSMTGHLLGAAGALEASFCLKSVMEDHIPPTINLLVPDDELDLDYVPNVGRAVKVRYAMSNSLGFGGHNGTIIIKKWEE